MISGFRHKGLRALFEKDDRRKLRAEDVNKIRRILARLNMAGTIEDVDAPGFRLHGLKGNRAGQWAVTVRANWRIVFRFEDGQVFDVDLVDYH